MQNTQTLLGKDEALNLRGVMAFPKIDEFYNELMDRLHMVLDQFFLEGPFTIFINALPRDHEEGTKLFIDRFIDVPLIYGGAKRQKEFIEQWTQKESTPEIDKFWRILNTEDLTIHNSRVSSQLYLELRRGDYELKDIQDIGLGYLKDYFSDIINIAQEAEHQVLNFYFDDISTYLYLSLPLIQFAEFDGVVHIILSKKDYENTFAWEKEGDVNGLRGLNTKVVGNVIKAFSREYEGLILDWDIVGDAKLKEEAFNDAKDPNKLYGEHSNPILQELKYQEYYVRHKTYFEDRYHYNKQVPLNIRQQYRQVAIIHILIDSYAHNISAHSLTALEWWFRQRADMMKLAAKGELAQLSSGTNGDPVVLLEKYDAPLNKEIHPLLRFLLDKGAFWTGLTRDNSFGGRIISLYNVLWRDFINNPLYLGTIAFTEGIVKINIHITFLKYESNEGNMHIKKKVELDGDFVRIDLTTFQNTSNDKELEDISDFVIQGADFKAIAEKLRKCKAFFPGGVVGEHAFFTILETELRNVKHYKTEELEKIRREGLTLNISIEEDSYRSSEERTKPGETHYYKIGVWLKHPLFIDEDLIKLRPKKLYDDIIEEDTFLPRLGGTYQDKVCAAMLFNNSFASVENWEKPRDKRYYPWLKAGSSSDLHYKRGESIQDFEISARRLFEEGKFEDSKQFFKDHFKPHFGYFKKFFHIWKGENIYTINNAEQLDKDWENISRFRFVYIPEDDAKLFQKVRELGIIRVINKQTNDGGNAYHQWLNKWLPLFGQERSNYTLEFKQDGELSAQIEIDENGVTFRNKDLKKVLPENKHQIQLIHNPNQIDTDGQEVIRYRNHGIFREYFCGRKKLSLIEKMNSDVATELLEVIATRICIFDNRIAGRFKEINTGILSKQLRCTIHGENESTWVAEKEKGFCRYHFLVVHLSFIEAIKDKNGNKYNENNIQPFIDNEILDGKTAPENFMLVITTGRGRTHWWDRLKSEQKSQKPGKEVPPYTSFVTFRPVESLTAAIENAITMKDDMELKYRLVKVLFGS